MQSSDLTALGAAWPVLAAIHNGCIGGGAPIWVCCADMRCASADAYFCIKEIDIGTVADVGTLQRLPPKPDRAGSGNASRSLPTQAAVPREARQIGRDQPRDSPTACRQPPGRDGNRRRNRQQTAAVIRSSGTKENDQLQAPRPFGGRQPPNFIATWNAAGMPLLERYPGRDHGVDGKQKAELRTDRFVAPILQACCQRWRQAFSAGMAGVLVISTVTMRCPRRPRSSSKVLLIRQFRSYWLTALAYYLASALGLAVYASFHTQISTCGHRRPGFCIAGTDLAACLAGAALGAGGSISH